MPSRHNGFKEKKPIQTEASTWLIELIQYCIQCQGD